MFLRVPWLVPELLRTFDRLRRPRPLCLSRGLNCIPIDEPIETWEDLVDWRRLQSTIGSAPVELDPPPGGRHRHPPVGGPPRVPRCRSECSTRHSCRPNGTRPTCRSGSARADWKVATHGYERLGAYFHLGSTTVGVLSEAYKQRVVSNGRAVPRPLGRRDSPRRAACRGAPGGAGRRRRDGFTPRWRRRRRSPARSAVAMATGNHTTCRTPAAADRALAPIPQPIAHGRRRRAPARPSARRSPSRMGQERLSRRLDAADRRPRPVVHAAIGRARPRAARTPLPVVESGRVRRVPRDAAAPGMVALDVGANVGAYAVLLGQWVGASGQGVRVRALASGVSTGSSATSR